MSIGPFHGAHHIFEPTATPGVLVPDGAALVFHANGFLSAFTLAAAAGTFAPGGPGPFDGMREIRNAATISLLILQQRVDGTFGSTTVELYRYRSGSFTRLHSAGALTLAFGGGNMARDTATPTVTDVIAGDVIVCQLIAAQADGEDISVAVTFE